MWGRKKIIEEAVIFFGFIAVGLFIYREAFHSSFQFDDYPFIVNNPVIHDLRNILDIFRSYSIKPLGTLTFAIDYYFYGLNVVGYHATNFIIHILSTLTLRWFILLTLEAPRLRGTSLAKDKQWIALLVSLIFLTHPVQIHAVTHITQRYVSLACLFYLLSLCFYNKARKYLDDDSYKPALFFKFFLACSFFALCGMLTRQTVVTLPLAVVLYEMCFFQPSQLKKILRYKTTWFVLAIFILIALVQPYLYQFNLSHYLKATYYSHSHQHETVTSYNYLLTQFRVLSHYIRLFFFPNEFTFDYDYQLSKGFFELPTFLSFLFLCFIFLGAAFIYRRHVVISFGIFWFFLTLSIESSIIPIVYVIEQYRLYLPLVGLSLSLVAGLHYMLKDIRKCSFVLSVFIAMLCYFTIQGNKVWQTEITFWEYALKMAPHKARTNDNLGAVYSAAGRYEEALRYLQKALSLDDSYAHTYNSLGQVYMEMGNLEKAVNNFEKAIEIGSGISVAPLNNLGVVYQRKGDLEKAEEYYKLAIRESQGFIEAYLNLATLYRKKGRSDAAIGLYEQIAVRFPHHKESLYSLVELYLEKKEAKRAIQAAQKILPKENNAELLTNLGSILAKNNLVDAAIIFYEKALRVDPKYKEVYIELGKFFGNMDRFYEAINIWKEGASLDPADPRFPELIQEAERLEKQLTPAVFNPP